MTKSTITRERLQEIAEDGFLKHGESKELARMALAAMESEPVAWTWHYREQWHVTNDKCRAEFVATDGDVAVLPLYRHAQSAQISEPVLPLQDKDLQGVIDALEHPAGINAAGKQVVRHALVEIQERRKAERDSNPVGWTDEAELRDVEKDGCGYLFKANPITLHADPRRVILLYRHAQPAPVVPEEKPIPNTLSMYAVDAVAAIAEVKGWNACRAAMLAAAPQEVK